MKSIIVRYSEIGLKGKNRQIFEKRLVSNIRKHLKNYHISSVNRRWSRIDIHTKHEIEPLLAPLAKIPGIANFSPVIYTDLTIDAIEEAAKTAMKQKLDGVLECRTTSSEMPLTGYSDGPITFRVSARRANKDFPVTSTDIEIKLGTILLKAFPQLKVQLKNPELDVGVEVWQKNAVVFTEKIRGIGGLSVNEKDKVISLMSGGIDSPVASWMIMKRGCEVTYLYFHSFPFIGEQTKEKVMDLVKILRNYQPQSRLYVAPFAEIQKAIKVHTPEKLRTILYRRFMNLIANRIARNERAQAIITGDSLAQVASQTLTNMICTTENAEFPVLRPLVGMDKNEIMAISRSIGTYSTSIQDFPDCCTVFQPDKPATKAFLPDVKYAESCIDQLEELVNDAVENCEIYDYSCSEEYGEL